MKSLSYLLKKGQTYYRKNELSKSKGSLNQVLEKEPKNKQALLLLGKINLEEKNFIQALDCLSKAESEELRKIRLSISSSSQLLEDIKNSIKPMDVEIYKELGLALEQLSYKQDEIKVDEDFRQILKKIMPPYWERHFNPKTLKSDMYMEVGNIWEILSEIAPDHLEILTNRAFWEHRWGGTTGSIPYIAKVIWEQILGFDERNVLAKYKISEYKSRQFQSLEQHSGYKSSIKSPINRELEIEEDYLRGGNFFKLVEDLEGLEKKKEDFKIKILLSKLYVQRGKDLKAKELLKDAIGLILKNEKDNLRPPTSGKSKNDILVYTYQSPFAYFFADIIPPGSIVFKKNGSFSLFIKEKKAIDYFRSINKKNGLCLNLPEVLCYTKFEDKGYMVMESELASHCNAYAIDASFRLGIEDESKKGNLLNRLVGEIAKIHAWFPDEGSGLLEIVHTEDKEKNSEYYTEKIRTKLFGVEGLVQRERSLWLSLKKKADSLFSEIVNERGAIKKRLEDKIIKETEDYKKGYNKLIQKIEVKETSLINDDYIQRLEDIKNKINSKLNREDNIFKEEFFKDYSVILEIISDLKPGAYKDSIFKNFLIDYRDNLVTIDFETLRNLPYQMDLATAFEFEDNSISDNDSEENSRKNLLKVYVQKFNEQIEKYNLQKEKIENFEDFEKAYYTCAVQRSLVHYGSFSSLKYDYDKCIKFIDKAVWNINRLKSYFHQNSIEHQKLNDLQELLNDFSSSNKEELEGLKNSLSKVEEEIRSFDLN